MSTQRTLYPPVHLDECRFLLLKIIEQAVRDYLSLETSKSPFERTVLFETARGFLFDDSYKICWGSLLVSLNDILDFLDLDIDWIREKVIILKENKTLKFSLLTEDTD